jgi:phosphocarrier protein
LKERSKSFIIKNKLGLHARAAAVFVNTANKFKSNIEIKRGNMKVNGKSILGVLMLAAGKGSKITIIVNGVDAEEAIEELGKLIDNGFGEE